MSKPVKLRPVGEDAFVCKGRIDFDNWPEGAPVLSPQHELIGFIDADSVARPYTRELKLANRFEEDAKNLKATP